MGKAWLRPGFLGLSLGLAVVPAAVGVACAPDATFDPGDAGAGSSTGTAGGSACAAPDASAQEQLLNACTTAVCAAYDNGPIDAAYRLGLPTLPGNVYPFDGGVADAGTVGVTCGDAVQGADVVYVMGPPSLVRLFHELGGYFADQGVIVAYQSTTSCAALAAMISGTQTLGEFGGAVYFDGTDTGAGTPCDPLVAGSPARPDLVVSDVSADSCFSPFGGFPDGLEADLGAVIPGAFVVPHGSDQAAVSREAAYLLYGPGAGVAPWSTASLYQRNPADGAQAGVGAVIGVPADQWVGRDTVSPSDEADGLAAASPEGALGMMAAPDGESSNQVSVIAYQHTGQSCGYWPDSQPGNGDRQNVIDGHYALWSPIVAVVPFDANSTHVGNATAIAVQNLLTSLIPDTTVASAMHDVGMVPACAMNVARDSNGELRPSPQPPSCGCYWRKITGQEVGCTTCSKDETCASFPTTKRCLYGYCEP
jgi:hypothetical protein